MAIHGIIVVKLKKEGKKMEKTKSKNIQRHTSKGLKFIRDLKLKYLYAETKKEQDFYAKLLEKIKFF
jgi:hypothetical protein